MKADVTKAKVVDWNLAYSNLVIHKPQYGIMIHGVPKTTLRFEEDSRKAIEEFEEANEELNIKAIRIKPLHRYPKPGSLNHSIVVFTEDAEAANRCIDSNVVINYQIFTAEKYAPQTRILQCLKCYDYGHMAVQCTKELTCGRCAKNHDTNQCTEPELKCTNCQGKHQAWHHECERRKRESDQLKQRRQTQVPAYFSI